MTRKGRMTIKDLPEEMLLYIFRKLPATEFITTLPKVCDHWLRIIASDVCTLKRIGMHHLNSIAAVDFYYFGDETERSQMLYWPPDEYERLLQTAAITQYHGEDDDDDDHEFPVCYAEAYMLCARYPFICGHIGTLAISSSLSLYAVGYTFIEHLTTLVFHGVRIREVDRYTLAELGTVYTNVEDVMFVECSLAADFDLKYLHVGFYGLRRFRADHNAVSAEFLDDLLRYHCCTLETAVLGGCTVTGDRWIDVLSERLCGRTVNSLSMHSAYFTDRCVNQFLNDADVDLPEDRSNVTIDNHLGQISFSINIDPLQ